MELNEIFKYILAVWRAIYLRKFKAVILVTVIAFTILVIGMFKPSIFNSDVTIFADTQNVIQPLLGKQTAITGVKQSRTTQVRDVIYSPSQMNKVIDVVYGKNAFPFSEREKKIATIRQNITVKGISGNYIKISYQDDNADRTFRILNEVVSLFLEDTANTKKNESRSAFNFIEQQVNSYKKQLLLAEEKLKIFKSTHLDGTESEVESRISMLRNDIEDLKIQQTESSARIYSLKKQLFSQDKYASNDYEAALFHSRLNQLTQHLDNLLLTYKDDYPEVLEARYQINNLEQTIDNLAKNEPDENEKNSGKFNPLYNEISSKLSTAQVTHNTIINRLTAFDRLLVDAYERRKRIANNQAELSELNRDYSVIQVQYEEMLSNKEKARLSMVLDIEGQGVNYKIQEPANYPTVPSGPRFLHFFIAGPIVGLLLLISIFIVKVLLDNKIRFAAQLASFTDTPLLVNLDHTFNAIERRKERIGNIFFLILLFCFLIVYATIAILHRYDYTILEIFSLLMEKI